MRFALSARLFIGFTESFKEPSGTALKWFPNEDVPRA